jgi:hypothetical protein
LNFEEEGRGEGGRKVDGLAVGSGCVLALGEARVVAQLLLGNDLVGWFAVVTENLYNVDRN